jgi:MFS family permease
VSAPVLAGAALMVLGSAPALLAVPLTEGLFGRSAIWMAAMAYTLGSLLAPAAASLVHRRGVVRPSLYLLCAAGAVVGWALAPVSLVLLCVAQLVAGICIALLEGLLDGAVSRRYPLQVTGALAMASAGRALGSAAGMAALPELVGSAGLALTAGGAALVLLCGAVVAHRWGRFPMQQAVTSGLIPLPDVAAETLLLQALERLDAPVTWSDLVRRVNPPQSGDQGPWRDRELRLVAAFQRLHRFGAVERWRVADPDGHDRYVPTPLASYRLRTGETPRLMSGLPPVPTPRLPAVAATGSARC